MVIKDVAKLKDYFLRSGIPLEVSTIVELSKIGIEDHGEIKYEREGKLFSTDIEAHTEFDITENLSLMLNFAIECKYKERNHNWIFMEFPEDALEMRTDCRNEVFDDFFQKSLELENKRLTEEYAFAKLRKENLFNLPAVNKGVDVFGSGFEGDTILEAIAQAVFGATSSHYDLLTFILGFVGDVEKSSPNVGMTIPVIVTTADIYKIKKNATLEEIEKSNISELLEKVPGVLYYHTDYSMISLFLNSLRKRHPINLNDEEKKFLDSHSSNIAGFIHPGYVYIVNYYNLKDCFINCINNVKIIIDNIKTKIV